jgi:hypothetical protein
MLSGFIIAIIVAALVFVSVFGPPLISALIADAEEQRKRDLLAKLEAEHREVARNIAAINTQLAQAFGGRSTRDLEISLRNFTAMREAAKAWLARETVDEEAATELYVACEWFDDEIDVVLSDETLTDSQKCTQIATILERSR